METWLRTCLLLCLYGFFKEFRPSEPFLTSYLTEPPMNLTLDEVTFDVYPVWTYSYLSLLIVVFLLTDLLRYKPMIMFEGLGYVITWCLLLWARGVHWMQVMEFFYGITTSTEVAYYTYIYAQVSSEYYQKVTSYTRAALQVGKFVSGVFSQLLTDTFDVLDYRELNYISLGSVIVALLIACCLPPVKTSVYFHRKETLHNDQSSWSSTLELQKETNTKSTRQWLVKVANYIWNDFKAAYSDRYLLKWSIWWAFATCGYFQVGNYVQSLWKTLAPSEETAVLYNGWVEAAATLLSALTAFSVGYFHLNWSLFGETTLALVSLLDGFLLLFMGLTDHIVVAYVNYVLFRASYQVMITVASYQVAKHLRADSYGLIFGINMFVALFLQTLLTASVIEALEIEPWLQFVIYGCYFGTLAFFFFVLSAYTCGRLGLQGMKDMGIWIKRDERKQRNESSLGNNEVV